VWRQLLLHTSLAGPFSSRRRMTWNPFSTFGGILTAVAVKNTSCGIVRKNFGSPPSSGQTLEVRVAPNQNTQLCRHYGVGVTLRNIIRDMLGSYLERDTAYTN
jgi:hypothetical protein